MSEERADFRARVTAIRVANAQLEPAGDVSSEPRRVASAYDPATDWTNYDSYNKFYSIYTD